jgi:hypothetical protein
MSYEHGHSDGLDFDSVLAEERVMAEERRPAYQTEHPALLTRTQFCARFGLSPHELDLLLRRPDFVAACCLVSEGGQVTRLVPGRFEAWCQGRGDAAAIARTPTWVALVAQERVRSLELTEGVP